MVASAAPATTPARCVAMYVPMAMYIPRNVLLIYNPRAPSSMPSKWHWPALRVHLRGGPVEVSPAVVVGAVPRRHAVPSRRALRAKRLPTPRVMAGSASRRRPGRTFPPATCATHSGIAQRPIRLELEDPKSENHRQRNSTTSVPYSSMAKTTKTLWNTHRRTGSKWDPHVEAQTPSTRENDVRAHPQAR